jgi:hypothetical protein
MRTLEHVLFSCLFAGELYAYIRTRSLLFFIRGRKFYAWIEHVLIFFIRGRKFYARMTYDYFREKKKGFENRVFEIRKRGYTRRSVLIYIYIYINIYKERKEGNTTPHRG